MAFYEHALYAVVIVVALAFARNASKLLIIEWYSGVDPPLTMGHRRRLQGETTFFCIVALGAAATWITRAVL